MLKPKLPLSFWAYGVGAHEGAVLASHWQTLEWYREHPEARPVKVAA